MTSTMEKTEAQAAEAVGAIVRSLVADEAVELRLHNGNGVTASLPGGAGTRVEPADGGLLRVVAGGWSVALDPATVRGLAVVEEVGGPAASAGDGARDEGASRWTLHLTGLLGAEVLRARRRTGDSVATGAAGAEDDGPFWRRFAQSHAGPLPVAWRTVTRRGPAGRVSPDLARRLLSELIDGRRVVFDVPTPQSSAELFPNLSLHDVHVSEAGWLLAGEPDRRDAHLHVHVGQLAAVRFTEDRRGEGQVTYRARFVDRNGVSYLDAYFPNPYRDDAGSPTGLSPEREAYFRTCYARYAEEPGVELGVSVAPAV